MAVYNFTHQSPGAPALTGTAGSLIPILDYCLLTAGWTKPFSGTNTAVYKQGTGSTGHYFVFNDTGAQETLVTASKEVTGVSSITNAFVSSSIVRKSEAASAVTRPWNIICNEKTVFMIFYTSLDASTQNFGNLGSTVGAATFWFGDFKTYRNGDQWNAFCHNFTTTGMAGQGAGYKLDKIKIPRPFTQIGQSITGGFLVPSNTNNNWSGYGPSFPDPIRQQINLEKVQVYENGSLNFRRGSLPGVWDIIHTGLTTLSGDTFSGSGNLSGKSFIIHQTSMNGGSISTYGRIAYETSNTWETY